MMTLIIQILFFLVVYILFFRSTDSTQEYSEASIQRALDRLRTTWDFEELKKVFYQELHRFPHSHQMLYHEYLNQQRLLQGLALEEAWAYNYVRQYIRERLSQCRTQQMVQTLYNQLSELLRRHPAFEEMFIRQQPRQKVQASTPKKRLFSMCSNIPEIKKRFRKLAFLNHPDRGGSSAAMQEILRQYEEALENEKHR